MKPGTHDVTVKYAWLKQSAGGTDGVALTFRNENGDQIDHVIWISPERPEIAADMLRRLGFDVHERDLSNPEDVSTLEGTRCTIDVEDEEYKNKVRPTVKRIRKPMPTREEQVATGKRIMKLYPKNGVSTTGAPEQDGDVPF